MGRARFSVLTLYKSTLQWLPEGGEPTIIVNAEGDRTTPSVVIGFRADGDRIVARPPRTSQSPTPRTRSSSSVSHGPSL